MACRYMWRLATRYDNADLEHKQIQNEIKNKVHKTKIPMGHFCGNVTTLVENSQYVRVLLESLTFATCRYMWRLATRLDIADLENTLIKNINLKKFIKQ